jgi:hypothetical protein
MITSTQASVRINLLDGIFIRTAITDFLESSRSDIPDDFYDDMAEIRNNCYSLWSDEEWDTFDSRRGDPEMYEDEEINSNRYWTLNMIECDALILAFQFLYVVCKQKQIANEYGAEDAVGILANDIIPRFANLFTQDEWERYEGEIDAEFPNG